MARHGEPRAMLPVVVIGGYLGAGKTTLVNHLLRHARGRRIAVLVNDFGAVGIDATLIEARDEQLLTLAGGCLCCSFGDDLVGMLQALARRDAAPDVVLIETSGVALPAAVARSARLAQGVAIDGVVVVADAETLRERAADIYVGDTVRQQLRDADLLLLNKADLVPGDAARTALHGWLAAMAPQAPVLDCAEAEVPPEVVLGLPALPGAQAPAAAMRAWSGADSPDERHDSAGPGRRLRAPAHAAARVQSHSLVLAGCADGQARAESLAAMLAAADSGLLRAKGWLVDEQRRGWTLQVVGRRWRVAAAGVRGAEAGDGALVIIGLRGGPDAAAWQARIDRAA
jgi:G3E family GTPase